MISRTPPAAGVKAPSVTVGIKEPEEGAAETTEAPALIAVEANFWLLAEDELPSICKLPPPKAKGEELLMRLAVEPMFEKSTNSVPALTVVVPV